MTITIAEIRNAINIPETKELSDAVITSAITRAGTYLDVLEARYTAPAEFFPVCESAYAIFLAYQSYSDRVLNVPPGAYEQGQWTPIQEEIVRNTADKLRGLREVYEDLVKIIRAYPPRPTGTFHNSGATNPRKFTIGQFDYPQTSDVFSVTYED